MVVSTVREKARKAGIWFSTITVVLGLIVTLTHIGFHSEKASAVGTPQVLGVTLTAKPDKSNGNCGNGNGSGNANCKSFTIAGSVTGLYPGATVNLPITVTNPNNQDINVTQITISVVATDKTGCAPSPSNLVPTNYNGPGFVVPRNSWSAIDLPITMPATVADECQDASFTLQYAGQGQA